MMVRSRLELLVGRVDLALRLAARAARFLPSDPVLALNSVYLTELSHGPAKAANLYDTLLVDDDAPRYRAYLALRAGDLVKAKSLLSISGCRDGRCSFLRPALLFADPDPEARRKLATLDRDKFDSALIDMANGDSRGHQRNLLYGVRTDVMRVELRDPSGRTGLDLVKGWTCSARLHPTREQLRNFIALGFAIRAGDGGATAAARTRIAGLGRFLERSLDSGLLSSLSPL